MNKTEYMRQLEQELRHLPKREREEALRYYREYFEDAGPEKEEEVAEELGDPKTAAAQILKDTAIKRLDEPRKAARKGFSTVWVVILALFAAPIGLPLLLAALIVGLALLVSVTAVFLSVGLCGIVLAAAGVFCAGVSIYFMPLHPLDGISILGSGLLCFGVGLLLLLAAVICGKAAGKWMAACARRLLTGGEKHEKVS